MRKGSMVIRDEHRSLAAVLHALRHVSRAAVASGKAPDFRLIDAMIAYIERFPEVCHHPKEDDHLYRLLRLRAPDCAATLDELHEQHRDGVGRLARLKRVLAAWEMGLAPAGDFAGEVEAYSAFHWAHMRIEEDIVLPRAEAALTAADWAEIDLAFGANEDPLRGVPAGGGVDFADLFRLIVNQTPAPVGLGPAVDAA